MKILMSCLSRSWGGMEMFVLTLTEQLINRKFECSLVCYPDSKIHQEAKKFDLSIMALKANSYFHPVQILNLTSFLNQNEFDIIHTHYSKDLWTLVPALNFSKSETPLILTKQLGSSIVKKDFLHRKLYNRVNMTTAISTIIRNNLLETCPVDENKVTIIFNAVDTNKFDPKKIDSKKARDEFDIKDNEIVIGMSARFTEGKGHEELLLAAKDLVQEYDNLKFFLVGEPSRGENTYGKKIRDMVDELKLSEKVIFTGFRTDMPEMYSAMDIFAFPSHSEAFGIALTEAMSMERACVASNANGILDIIEDNKNGLMFENKNYLSLKEKLEQLINSKSERERLGKEARKTVIQKFEIQKITDDFAKLYNKLKNNQ
ncbi:glycosyltransferase [hydrocarbon metagenome]|uniref:Glycosyltransferase n=1 Tax=hydrocarbon metagenome TaxID=938273 RepID=A0A0W8FVA5_9ZZZZ